MLTIAPIKLFVDAHVLDGEYQGTRTFIIELYTVLSAREDLQLYIGAYDIENLKNCFGETRGIYFIKYRSRSSLVRLAYDIPKIIRQYNIRYAHFQYVVPFFKNCKFIVTTHDVLFNEYPQEFPFWFRKSRNFFYKRSAQKANILTTDSEYSKSSIQKYLHIPAFKINVLSPGVGTKFYSHYNKEKAKELIKYKYGFEKIILYVSRIEPRKNHSTLLRAYLDLQLYKEGYYLVLLGHLSNKVKAFEKMLNSVPKEIKSFIFITGKINNSELLQFYQAASVFVYPSKAEGFGIPPLEGAAAKVPVICSNTTAMRDFNFFGENHINPDDPEQIKKRLLFILKNKTEASSLNILAETIRLRYSWEMAAESFVQLIKNDLNLTIR